MFFIKKIVFNLLLFNLIFSNNFITSKVDELQFDEIIINLEKEFEEKFSIFFPNFNLYSKEIVFNVPDLKKLGLFVNKKYSKKNKEEFLVILNKILNKEIKKELSPEIIILGVVKNFNEEINLKLNAKLFLKNKFSFSFQKNNKIIYPNEENFSRFKKIYLDYLETSLKDYVKKEKSLLKRKEVFNLTYQKGSQVNYEEKLINKNSIQKFLINLEDFKSNKVNLSPYIEIENIFENFKIKSFLEFDFKDEDLIINIKNIFYLFN